MLSMPLFVKETTKQHIRQNMLGKEDGWFPDLFFETIYIPKVMQSN